MGGHKVNYGNTIAASVRKWGDKALIKASKGAIRPWTPEVARGFHALTQSIAGLEILLDDEYFLNLNDILFPSHREDIYGYWEEKYIKKKDVNLVIFIEAIGSGKSSKFSVLQWLQWFELTTRCNIQEYYRTMPDEVTAFISMSRSEVQAKRVVMSKNIAQFKTQFNREYFPPDPRKGQEIYMARNFTTIFAGTSSGASALGYNIYGGCIDEANFLEVVEDSTRRRGKSETYDAAEDMHTHMFGRMRSRFINPYTGELDGTLFMFSSTRYPDDFLEKKAKEHFTLQKKSNIFISRKTLWAAKPKWYFSGVTFKFDIAPKKILADEDEIEKLRALAVIAKGKNQPIIPTPEDRDVKKKERRQRANWQPPE